MSTIKSRRRRIRFELGILLILIVVLIFPLSPRMVWRATTSSDVYQMTRAALETAHLEREIQNGNPDAEILLATSYASNDGFHRFMEGDHLEILLPLVEANELTAVKAMAWVARDSDPDYARELFLRAADLGDEEAQVISFPAVGLDILDTEKFMQGLYRLQQDRPGWKASFDRYKKILETESAAGNVYASRVLDGLEQYAQSSRI